MDLKLFRFHLGKIKKHRELKHIQMPKSIREIGERLAPFKPEQWIIERTTFWMYAYDRKHKWTSKDWHYEINEAAWEKAKEKRKERAEERKQYAIKKDKQQRPPDYSNLTSWDEVSGQGPQKALEKLGFKTMEEALSRKPKDP